MRPLYYSRQGRPLTRLEWARSFDNLSQEARRVAETWIDEVWVSTVWVGLDHNYTGIGPPLIFETMIFGGEWHEDTWRTSTEEEALTAHQYACALVRGEVSFE